MAKLLFVVLLDIVNRLYKLDHLLSESLLDQSILIFLLFLRDDENLELVFHLTLLEIRVEFALIGSGLGCLLLRFERFANTIT